VKAGWLTGKLPDEMEQNAQLRHGLGGDARAVTGAPVAHEVGPAVRRVVRSAGAFLAGAHQPLDFLARAARWREPRFQPANAASAGGLDESRLVVALANIARVGLGIVADKAAEADLAVYGVRL
jgi:hypothetical protein